MTYGSTSSVVDAQEVADRFWNDYFGSLILAAESFGNPGSTPSGSVPSGKFTVPTWYWQQEVVPRFSNAPSQARGSQASRNINEAQFGVGSNITGGTGTGSVHVVLRAEMNRHDHFVNSFTWTAQRTLQQYQGNTQQNVYSSTKKRYATFNEFTTNPTNTIASGDTVGQTEFDALFNAFAQTYTAQRNAGSHTQATNYTICHSSCHSSCHRNRGRR